MSRLSRMFRHFSIFPWHSKRVLSQSAMAHLEEVIKEAEVKCAGQVCVAIEAELSTDLLWQNVLARHRAIDVFSKLRVWDTENNSGVLVYLLLADRDVEIVADRGIAKRVSQAEWEKICRIMESSFSEGNFEKGLIKGVQLIGEKLAEHFPSQNENLNELPNQPYVL